jgi:hypothetical protein
MPPELGNPFGRGMIVADIVYKRGNFTAYFPLGTSIILSLLLTLILWFLNRK